MRELSLNPVGLLLAFERRAAQLAQLNARLGPRDDAARTGRRRGAGAAGVLQGRARISPTSSALWRGAKMARLVARLVELHRELLANSAAGEILLAQALAGLTARCGTLSLSELRHEVLRLILLQRSNLAYVRGP